MSAGRRSATDTLAALRKATAPTPETKPETFKRRPKPRTVRYTLDLEPDEHRWLRRFAFEADMDVSALYRAFIRLLRQDASFSERILEEASQEVPPSLAKGGGSRG